MSRKVATLLALLAFLGLGFRLFGDGPELKKKAGEFDVGMRMDRNPPIRGDNAIEISVRDAAGGAVDDVKILVNYYMPPMPRMVPMNYRVEAKLKKDLYRAKMTFIMEGPWIIAVKITHDEKTVTAKFNIDVR